MLLGSGRVFRPICPIPLGWACPWRASAAMAGPAWAGLRADQDPRGTAVRYDSTMAYLSETPRLTYRSSERFAIDGKARRTWTAAVGDHPSSEPDPVSSDGKRSDMDVQSIISLLLSAGSS